MSATSMQRPGRLDLELVKGDDAVLELSFVDELGAPVNMAGRAWQLRLSGPGFAVELDGLVVTTFASSGVLSLPFPDTTTSAIPSGTTWYLRDNTNDRTLLDGEVRAYVAGYAGAGAGTTTQTVTITNDTAAVTVTASVGTASVGTGGGADLSDTTPQALGTAAAGTGTAAARDDHVHAMPTAADVGADADGAAQAVADTLGGAALLDVGTTTGTVAAGDDARLSDARTPTSHNHAASEVTSGTLDIARIPTGTTSTTVPLGNDSRFSDTRTPNVAGSNDDFMQRKAGAWTYRTVAQVQTDLGVPLKYVVPRITGEWYSADAPLPSAVIGGSLALAGRLTLLPVYLHAGTIDRIGVYTTSAGSGTTWRLGIYPSGTDGLPDGQARLLDAGTVDMGATAGLLAITISQSIATAGLYWLAALCDAYSAYPTVSSWNASSFATPTLTGVTTTMVNATAGSAFCRTLTGVTTGSIPSTCPSMNWHVSAPKIAVRAA